MAAMEQPFGEVEVRYFLAEILKTSSISPLDLLNFIQEKGIQPSWYEMSLPYGRSVSSCIGVWQHLLANSQARFTAPVHPMAAFEHQSSQSASKPKKKRPASGENLPSVADRMIQPQQPSNFPPVNAPGDPATGQLAAALVPGGPPKKKRGRPSKAEHEAKVAEAAARGEEYKPTPRRKKPRPPQNTVNAGLLAPSITDVGAGGEFSTANNKARKPNAAPEEASSPAFGTTSRNFAFEATAHPADKMRVEEDKPVQSNIPETQASGFETRESLLANMREHAGQYAPDSIQSTMTLQHDSTPQHNFISYQGPTRDPAPTGEQHFL